MSRPRTNARRFASAITVQGWFYVVLAVMTVLVALGSVVGAQLLHRTTAASDRLIRHIQPARAEAYRLQAALIDQETGARGYALTADRQFLAPYTEGQRLEAASARAMRRLLAGDTALLRSLADVEEAAAQWRVRSGDPLVAGVTPGAPKPLDRQAATQAKQAFDELRQRFDAQNAELVAARDAQLEALGHARTRRDSVFVAMIAIFLVTGLVMTLLVRMLVIRPLRTLRASSRRIADGHFDHGIDELGPADIRGVAHDVDRMRRRVVDDLTASRVQERLLTEQAADLDAQALELRRSNAELEQFAYVASHDLQEPLRKVASFCQLLEKRYGDVLDERGRQYVDFAVDGAKRMQVLINDLLTFSRVGRLNEASELVDLDVVVAQALKNLSTAVEESQAEVTIDGALPEVWGDPTLLEMLWQNLVGNAIKFRAADRAPRITIATSPDPDGNGWLISVSDNGIGVPAEFAEKVFVIFQRLHSRETYTGTGIGLALCKKIVDFHGGRIWLDTSYVDGARLCLTLPDPSSTEHAGRVAASQIPTLEGTRT